MLFLGGGISSHNILMQDTALPVQERVDLQVRTCVPTISYPSCLLNIEIVIFSVFKHITFIPGIVENGIGSLSQILTSQVKVQEDLYWLVLVQVTEP